MRFRLIVALVLVPSVSAVAQVGYLPTQSPFREIEHSTYLELSGGRVLGSGGLLNLGPRDGMSEGLRWVLRGKNTLQISLGAWTAGTPTNPQPPYGALGVWTGSQLLVFVASSTIVQSFD